MHDARSLAAIRSIGRQVRSSPDGFSFAIEVDAQLVDDEGEKPSMSKRYLSTIL